MTTVRRIGTVEIHAPTVWLTYTDDTGEVIVVEGSDPELDVESKYEGTHELACAQWGWGVRLHASGTWVIVDDPVALVKEEFTAMTELIVHSMLGALSDEEKRTYEEKIRTYTNPPKDHSRKESGDRGGRRQLPTGQGGATGRGDGCMGDAKIPR